jgi:hypothetical protein
LAKTVSTANAVTTVAAASPVLKDKPAATVNASTTLANLQHVGLADYASVGTAWTIPVRASNALRTSGVKSLPALRSA